MRKIIKRAVKRALFAAGYKLVPIELADLVALQMLSKRDFFFVQIGANDGITNDPIHEFVINHNWRGILVEPDPIPFAKLVANYEGKPGLIFENCAVANETGARILYVMEDNPTLPAWTSGMGSLDRSVLLRHNIPNVVNFIREKSVKCITLDELFLRHNVKAIDLLQIDAEGYDYEILMMFNLSRWKPSIIHYEDKHIPTRERAALMDVLIAHGYKVRSNGIDTLAHRHQ
jgi:FkbM family methyltransferase